ncbi:MAG: NAD metabolism ATPase/kinase [Cytophagaceae bacterium]|nr:NAD metabolism ATPase/kinase [Cytophagaceae bacterium]
MKFTEAEISEIKAHGLTLEQVEEQVSLFTHGVPKVQLVAPATVKDGVLKLNKEKRERYIHLYQDHKEELDVLKFTPASGAASRMFKNVYQFLADYDPEKETLSAYLKKKDDKFLDRFFKKQKKFPFYDVVMQRVNELYTEEQLEDKDFKKYAFVKTMMAQDELDYGSDPKGLLIFHNYDGKLSTAFEEHLYEASAYARQAKTAKLHFTVSPEHKEGFARLFDNINPSVSADTDTTYRVSYSFQKPETDTVAVTQDNKLYRKPTGELLFRPGGHGALINNLNDMDADVIFIKNIDNVLTRDKLSMLAKNKKMLAGVLLELQEQMFEYAELLDKDKITEEQLEKLTIFLTQGFSIRLREDYDDLSLADKKTYLFNLINRPIRICGMVKNEGEPGGGPFFVKDKNGKVSLQIIESAQVDLNDPKQYKIFKQSTHFNPVDVVAGVRDFKGDKFDLKQYVDPELAFIASKTDNGTPIKALELPGLWNGAMAKWNTIFVEVPVKTFNPVKTVNDLLKPSHQAKSE